MRRTLAILAAAALLLVASGPVTADTIALRSGDLRLGGTVTFTVAVDHRYDCVGNRKCARVLVECYQSGLEVYGEGGDLGQARGDGTSPVGNSGFLLGGASSLWLTNGGPADCTATLFRFDYGGKGQTFVPIASVPFEVGA